MHLGIVKNLQSKINFDSIKNLVESKIFEQVIVALIIVNAITLGIETDRGIVAQHGNVLAAIDRMLLSIFTVELLLRVYVYRGQFFKDGWSIFDTIIVTVAWMPASGGLSILRALRILRVLRLLSVVPSLRKVVSGIVRALPGMSSIIFLLLLVSYIFAVIATNMFSEEFPEWFGSLSESSYTLFQVMTLESWSMGIVRPIMEVFPYAWILFVAFIICTSFTVLNLFIGVIVSAMSAETDAAAGGERKKLKEDQDLILEELRALRADIARTQKNN